jgi:hypothetical protein
MLALDEIECGAFLAENRRFRDRQITEAEQPS